MSTRSHAFGPSAIATPANALTLSRLVAAPIFAVLVAETGPASWGLAVVWFALASSDYFDGYIARRHGPTRSGAFLDPLADKFIALGALCALASIKEVMWLPVGLIAVREIAMSAFRTQAGKMGVSVPARPLAKLKTLVQDLAIALALIPIVSHHLMVVRIVLWVAVVLTLVTGAQYFWDARRGAGVDGVLARVIDEWKGCLVLVRVEIVAVGSELLLGQNVDTNSTVIAEALSAAGMDCYFQTRVGDNIERIVSVLGIALARCDAVIVCGGLGPTQDDVTREGIAKVMGVALVRDPEVLEKTRAIFASRGRQMAANNEQQADVPVGATIISQVIGTAPGLICPVGDKVIYAVPGVPDEMEEMLHRAILPDLAKRSGESAVIASRTLRTWGMGESALAELVAPRVDALAGAGQGVPTIAFLASGIEGIKVRITVKARDLALAKTALDTEEVALRELIGEAVFGIDDETMEHAIGALLLDRKWTLGLAESFTGGLIAARIVAQPGASAWFLGGVVSYATSVKHDVLGIPDGPVVSADAARDMALGVRTLLGTDVGLSTTGVAGPDPQEGHPPGTAFAGIALPGDTGEGLVLSLVGGRNRIREVATITALDALRRRLLLTTSQ